MLLSLPLRAAANARRARTGARAALVGGVVAALLMGAAPAEAQQGDRFIWTQLKLGPGWDPYPEASSALLAWLAGVTSARVAPERRGVSPPRPAPVSPPVLSFSAGAAPPPPFPPGHRRPRPCPPRGGVRLCAECP